ncbi:MAG TPA: ribosome maturation factor RimP [Actinomycetes bacterium]|jgi:ribosome maturation factor RimP|nr:ribosome maturation factor RimP [Actinomycetes bacterium]
MTMLPSRVQELAEQIAAEHGVEVLELALRRHGRSRVLSVVLDSDDPIGADVIERVTKGLSRALDEDDPLPGSYTLEVTTPGLDRPLRTGRDYRRQRGHEVQILREASGDEPRSEMRGVVVTADDQAVTLEVAGDQLRVLLSDVVRGKVVLPW